MSLWDYASRSWAEKAWRRWLGWAGRSRLPPMAKAAAMIREHLEAIGRPARNICFVEAKYAGYIDRQANEVERFKRMENRRIPDTFDYTAVPQLRQEARDKLSRVRPASVGQASRVSGITPADLAVLLFYLD